MSRVVPFRALRPGKPFVGRVAALPYDVLNIAEARRQVRENPLSFIHMEKAEIDLSDAAGVADQGRVMPPKYTWFEPKLRSSLFVHLLE